MYDLPNSIVIVNMNLVPGRYSDVIDNALSPDIIVPVSNWLHLLAHSWAWINDSGR